FTEAEAEPAELVAVAVSVFAPSLSGTLAEYVLPLFVAVTPLTFTVTVPEPPKLPLTVTGVVFVSVPFAGEVIVTDGGGVVARASAAAPNMSASASKLAPQRRPCDATCTTRDPTRRASGILRTPVSRGQEVCSQRVTPLALGSSS